MENTLPVPQALGDFMYAVMKEARRYSLMEVLENFDVTEDDYDEIANWFAQFGVKL